MMNEFGLSDLTELADSIIKRSREAVLAEIAKVPLGTYKNTMMVDGYDRPIELMATTTVSKNGVHVDFDGTSPLAPFGINVPIIYTTAYTCFGLSCIISPQIPNNAGSLAPFTVSAPVGSILNAPFPNPVATRHVIGQMLPDVVFGCLRQAVPERIPAEGASCVWSLMLRGLAARRNDIDGGFTITANTNGGTGARPMKDGLSATAYPSGIRGTPVEITESASPIVYWRKEYRPDSGGAGRYRGGHGQIVELSSLDGEPFEILAAFDRIDFPPRGQDGGADGANGHLSLASGQVLRGKGFQDIPAGDRLIALTPGGGGLGHPFDREPAAVQQDIIDELVSVEVAAQVYGVKFADKNEIDTVATKTARQR
jgi:N-methylhydantoinase B